MAKTKQDYKITGDAHWCETCQANTMYLNECAVCSIPSHENALKYQGNLSYLRTKYVGY